MGAETLTFTQLPTEILIHICSFLDAGYVRTVLSLVNRRLAQLGKIYNLTASIFYIVD